MYFKTYVENTFYSIHFSALLIFVSTSIVVAFGSCIVLN